MKKRIKIALTICMLSGIAFIGNPDNSQAQPREHSYLARPGGPGTQSHERGTTPTVYLSILTSTDVVLGRNITFDPLNGPDMYGFAEGPGYIRPAGYEAIPVKSNSKIEIVLYKKERDGRIKNTDPLGQDKPCTIGSLRKITINNTKYNNYQATLKYKNIKYNRKHPDSGATRR